VCVRKTAYQKSDNRIFAISFSLVSNYNRFISGRFTIVGVLIKSSSTTAIVDVTKFVT